MTRSSRQSNSLQGSHVRNQLVVPRRTEKGVRPVSPMINFVDNSAKAPVSTPAQVKQDTASKKLPAVTRKISDTSELSTKPSRRYSHTKQDGADTSSKKLHKKLGATAHKTQLLSNGVNRAKTKTSRRRLSWRRHAIHFIALALILLSGYVSVDTWLTNRRVEAQNTIPASSEKKGETHQDQEGKDETPPAENSLATYRVAAQNPRALYIDKLGVAAKIKPMGVNSDGSMQAPLNVYDAGWYNASAVPSRAGAVMIDGHVSGPTQGGLFENLGKLTQGDTIVIETGDRKQYTYRVAGKETVDRHKVDMQKFALPYGNATKGVNLITCAGKWQEKDQTFNQRTIVYTELVE